MQSSRSQPAEDFNTNTKQLFNDKQLTNIWKDVRIHVSDCPLSTNKSAVNTDYTELHGKTRKGEDL